MNSIMTIIRNLEAWRKLTIPKRKKEIKQVRYILEYLIYHLHLNNNAM